LGGVKHINLIQGLTMSTKNLTREFPFVGSHRLETLLDIGKAQRVRLRERLPSPLYWWQMPEGRKIFWNWVLVRDYLINGGNTPDHQRLIEEYLATLEGKK
jgi:hypothetical protein